MGEDDLPKTEFMTWLDEQVEGDKPTYDSWREMSRKTGVSATTLHRLRGGDTPSLKVLQRLSDATHYDLAELQRMAGILEEDQQAHDELSMIVRNILDRLPEAGKRAMLALGEELLRQQKNGQ